jgi:hypothetical protein
MSVSSIGPTGPLGVPGSPAPHQNGHLVRKLGMQGVASMLGMSNQQLVQTLNSGQSLAEVLTANGKTLEQGAEAFAAGVQSGVNAAAASGTISATRAATVLQHVTNNLNTELARTGQAPIANPGTSTPATGAPGSLLDASAYCLIPPAL